MHRANADEGEGLRRLGGGPANLEALPAFGEKRPADFTGLQVRQSDGGRVDRLGRSVLGADLRRLLM